MWNKTLRNTDRHEERQGSGGERDNGMKERSYKGRHADGQIYRDLTSNMIVIIKIT